MVMKHDKDCERTDSLITCMCASRAYKRNPIPDVPYMEQTIPLMTIREQWAAYCVAPSRR